MDDRALVEYSNLCDNTRRRKFNLTNRVGGKNTVLIPCFVQGNHFTLLAFTSKTVDGKKNVSGFYMDSVRGQPPEEVKQLAKEVFTAMGGSGRFKLKEFTGFGAPHQTNSSDCGFFVIEHMFRAYLNPSSLTEWWDAKPKKLLFG